MYNVEAKCDHIASKMYLYVLILGAHAQQGLQYFVRVFVCPFVCSTTTCNKTTKEWYQKVQHYTDFVKNVVKVLLPESYGMKHSEKPIYKRAKGLPQLHPLAQCTLEARDAAMQGEYKLPYSSGAS